MSLPQTRPRQKPNLNWRSLPIGPAEAFVLSQVDGRADVVQLGHTTGLPESQLLEILRRLAELQAIDFDDPAPPLEGPAAASRGGIPAQPAPATHSEPTASASPAPSSPLPPPRILVLDPLSAPASIPRFDVQLLDEPADLELDLKVQILELEYDLARKTHYELLEVPEDAEKRVIKDAFFKLINTYHVDKYFGKNLGIFRAKMERLSTALTKAHDTLSRNKTRAEYDAYLASRRETKGIRDSLPPSQFPGEVVEVVPSRPDPRSDLGSGERAIPSASSFPPLDEVENGDLGETSKTNEGAGTIDPQIQRRLLARRLGLRTSAPAGERDSSDPPVDPFAVRELIAKEMKARFDSRHNEGRAQAQMYVDMAKVAQEESKWGSAINALRVALALVPDDPEIKDRLAAVTAIADRDMADKFADQAKYEQRDGYYDRAMRSYERAARGKESAGQLEEAGRFYHEAAICAAREGADPKRIAELARRAVAANGKKVEYRIDLARAYDRLNMRSSALGEVQRALDLDPQNQAAQALQKQLR